MSSIKNFLENGFIPGPDESKEIFLKRVEALQAFNPPIKDALLSREDWLKTQKKTQELYGFSPSWMVAYYNNKGLSFFQGAATWITENGIPLIQLRKKLQRAPLLGMYRKEELLAHEAVHAARMVFDEPYFEEILAYRTSPQPWRRFLGPLFQRPWEAYTFIILLLLPLGVELLKFFELRSFAMVGFAPFGFLSLLICRLILLQSVLKRTESKLKYFLIDPKDSSKMILCLTDREIFSFSKLSKQRIREWIVKQNSFRWKTLKELLKL